MTDEIQRYTELVRGCLSNKRYKHSVAVADMCFKLAALHGADPVEAYTAGILHDIRKETAPELIKKEAAKSGLCPDPVELRTPALWHAVAGAAYVRDVLGVENPDIIGAIRFHTIARADMTRLEKVVYLGDLVSKDRQYDDVEKFRRLAFEDLDNAMFEAVRWSIEDTIGKSGRIPRYTFEAYGFYIDYKIKGNTNG